MSTRHLRDVSRFHSIRVADTSAGVMIFASSTSPVEGQASQYETKIWGSLLEDLGEDMAEVTVVPQLLPAPPRWDVIQRDGTYRFVFEQGGGAVNSLTVRDTEEIIAVPSKKHPLVSFSQPRFFRDLGPRGESFVSAIADDKQLVVFQSSDRTNYSKFLRVGDWSDGVILSRTNGFLVFCKETAPGPARNEILPGIIHSAPLDKACRSVGKTTKPLGDRLVYEFDADIIQVNEEKERFVLLATTIDDIVLAVSGESLGDFTTIEVSGDYAKMDLSSPALALSFSGTCHVAFLEAPQTSNARLWVGSTPIQR